MSEIWKAHRPKRLVDVVGQDATIKMLLQYLKKGNVPHALLFAGPSGCGKTTTARCLATALGCDESDLTEINCAIRDPMKMSRDIGEMCQYGPLAGKARIWILDEFQALSRARFSQQALFKILEDTRDDCYFMICTTDPVKISAPIKNRCTQFAMQSLKEIHLVELLNVVVKREGGILDNDVRGRIVELSEGSARQALKLLESVLGLEDKEEQLECLHKSEHSVAAIELARALIDVRKTWPEVAKILKALEDERPEDLRLMVLGYFSSVILGGGKMGHLAHAAIEIFRDDVDRCGMPGIRSNCWYLKNPKR